MSKGACKERVKSSVVVDRLDAIKDVLDKIRLGLVGDLPSTIAESKGAQIIVKTLDKASTFTDTVINIDGYNLIFIKTDGNQAHISYKIRKLTTEITPAIQAEILPKISGYYKELQITNSTAESGKTVYIICMLVSPILLSGFETGQNSISLSGVLEKGSFFSRSKAAASDWFASNISPTKTPCMHRISIFINTGTEKVYLTRDDSGEVYTNRQADLNKGVDLTNLSEYIFDVVLLEGQSYNIQHTDLAISVVCTIIEYPNIAG